MVSRITSVLRMFPLLALGLMLACGAAAIPVATAPTPDPLPTSTPEITDTSTDTPEKSRACYRKVLQTTVPGSHEGCQHILI